MGGNDDVHETASLPTIDISPYLDPEKSEAREATAEALNRACTQVGFFYLTGHGVPLERTQSVIDLARQFFLESSDQAKAAIQRNDPGVEMGDGARGYQKIGENVTKGRRDWHEAIDIYAEHPGNTVPPFKLLRGHNLWPEHPATLKGVFESYIEQVKRIGTAVVRAMGDALRLDQDSLREGADIFAKATDNSFWVLRMIGYPGLPGTNCNNELNGDADQFSCGEHTDYGCVTLLLTDSTPNALQVQSKSGDWITANPMPGAFVVNIGDMMQRWTNGIWQSTNHRVIHRNDQYRVSVPFFFEPNWDAVIEPLQTCVERDPKGESHYDKVVYGPYLQNKIANNFY